MQSDSIQRGQSAGADRYSTGWLVLRFFFALIVGYGTVVALGFGSFPLIHDSLFSGPVANLSLAALASLCGGILSGWILGPALRRRRWRFLYLAAACPALPVWLLWVAEHFRLVPAPIRKSWTELAVMDLEIPDLFVLCFVALAGAVGGYRLRNLRKTVPRLLAHIFVGLTAGFTASLALFAAFVYLVILLYWGRTNAYGGPPSVLFLFYLPPFVGGIPCGFILQPVVSGRRYRFLYLAAVSPVFPLWAAFEWLVRDWGPGGFIGLFSILALIFWVGTLVGYGVRHLGHRKWVRAGGIAE
jgi:hypothetical protein